MHHDLLSFRNYMELVEIKPSYIDKLRDEMGIDPNTSTTNPQWLGNATLGKTTYNGLTYEFRYVKDGAGQITGAMVKPIQTQRAYVQDSDGRMIRTPKNSADSGKEFFVTKSQIEKMLTQGMDQPPADPSGGAAGGMPGLDAGGGMG